MLPNDHECTADDGSRIQLLDVVAGQHADLVDALVDTHQTIFPSFGYVAEVIRQRASSDQPNPHVRVHQWLVLVDAAPAGLLLFDTNVARTVAISHYVHVASPFSSLSIEGRRMIGWLYRKAIEVSKSDCDGRAVLGLFGETTRELIPIYRLIGMHDLAIDYYEPLGVPHWQGPGTGLLHGHLLWLPPDGVDHQRLQQQALNAGAAAFLLDHYRFDPDIDWVAAAVGVERPLPVSP